MTDKLSSAVDDKYAPLRIVPPPSRLSSETSRGAKCWDHIWSSPFLISARCSVLGARSSTPRMSQRPWEAKPDRYSLEASRCYPARSSSTKHARRRKTKRPLSHRRISSMLIVEHISQMKEAPSGVTPTRTRSRSSRTCSVLVEAESRKVRGCCYKRNVMQTRDKSHQDSETISVKEVNAASVASQVAPPHCPKWIQLVDQSTCLRMY